MTVSVDSTDAFEPLMRGTWSGSGEHSRKCHCPGSFIATSNRQWVNSRAVVPAEGSKAREGRARTSRACDPSKEQPGEASATPSTK